MTFFSEATDVRDRAQADNLSWIASQEGPNGKILVFASRYHLSSAPVKTAMSRGGSGNAVAGTYLRPRFGDRLVTIANLIGKGTWGCTGFSGDLEQPSARSMDRIAGELGRPLFLLDLRQAPAPVTAWLNQEHQLGGGEGAFELVLGKAFDVLFYLDTVTPACPK
jgi:erythromycin esterase-like protein